jgi:hypothetical protein
VRTRGTRIFASLLLPWREKKHPLGETLIYRTAAANLPTPGYGVRTCSVVCSSKAWTRIRMDDWELIPPARTILIANIDGDVRSRDQERGTHSRRTTSIRANRFLRFLPWQKKPVSSSVLRCFPARSYYAQIPSFPARVIAGSASRARFCRVLRFAVEKCAIPIVRKRSQTSQR